MDWGLIGEILGSPGFYAICMIISAVVWGYAAVSMWLYNRRRK